MQLAKIFINNRSQAILSGRPTDWSAYLASGPVASQEFMEGIEDLPVQGRDL